MLLPPSFTQLGLVQFYIYGSTVILISAHNLLLPHILQVAAFTIILNTIVIWNKRTLALNNIALVGLGSTERKNRIGGGFKIGVVADLNQPTLNSA